MLAQPASKLTASDEGGPGQLGWSVALSADGTTALVGGPYDQQAGGAAWVFTRTGSTWTQQGPKLIGGNATGSTNFGFSVALSADGNTALVGDPTDANSFGAVWVFTRSGSSWTRQGPKLTGGSEAGAVNFGEHVALSGDGDTALIGSNDAASVFTRSGSNWTQQGSDLVVEPGTGGWAASVALSMDGNTALVGAAGADGLVGAAWVFTRSGSTWTQQGAPLTGSDESGPGHFGWSVALSGDGNTALIGGPWDDNLTGAEWLFTRSGTTWAQQGSKLPSVGASGTLAFGLLSALSTDGNTALVGGIDTGSNSVDAWVFNRSGSDWAEVGSTLDGTARPGGGFSTEATISGDGGTVLVGADKDSSAVGAAWAFSVPAKAPVIPGGSGGGGGGGSSSSGGGATTAPGVTAPSTSPSAPAGPAAPKPASKQTGPHRINGTRTADHLTGTPGADLIQAGAGNDWVNGGGGNDTIYGGAGNDTLFGGLGADRIYGGPGNDTIHAADGVKDTIDCGTGHDIVYADKHDQVARNCEVVHRA